MRMYAYIYGDDNKYMINMYIYNICISIYITILSKLFYNLYIRLNNIYYRSGT